MITLSGLSGWQIVQRKNFYYWIHHEKEYLSPRRFLLTDLLRYKPDLNDTSLVATLRIRYHHLKGEKFTYTNLQIEL